MLFCSGQFILFFLGVFGLYWTLPSQRARVGLLLAASLYFYASWNPWLAVLITVSASWDYLLARGMDALTSLRWRKLLLLGSLVSNLGLLCYFKYVNFFLRSLEEALARGGASISLPVLEVMVPIGISFYTFEAISYTVDVFQKRIPAERNLAHFLLFILFFPHLVAGPIVRGRDFLPQIRRRKRWDWARMHLGGQYLLMGLFKKLAIADHLSLYVDPVFADPAGHCSRAVWLATLAYPLQVYCDFSGYSDMALGFAHMLGYKLARNFNLPFLAVNIADFWRRWHISLSTWLRDYLFIPLGGSRSARWKIGCNLLVTMTLAGLWHGANWPFVVFGFLQGLLLLGHRWFREFCARRPRLQVLLQTAAGTILRMGLTFTSFALALIVFRAPTLSAASTIYHRMMVPHEGQLSPLTAHSLLTIGLLVAVCHAPPRSSSGLGGSCGCRARWWACVMPSPCRWL